MWDNYKLPTIINYCRRIWTINNPYRYASSIKYKTIYTKARKNRDIYAKSPDYRYKAFLYIRSKQQPSRYKPPLGLYCRSPIHNMIDKCCTFTEQDDEDKIGFLLF